MWRYALKHIAQWILALAFLCVLSFGLLKLIPGDPVLGRLQQSGVTFKETGGVYASAAYREIQHEMDLDLPIFYFTIQPLSVPDALNNVRNPEHRKTIRSLCIQWGNPEAVLRWYQSHQQLAADFENNPQLLNTHRAILLETDFEAQSQHYSTLIAKAKDSDIADNMERVANLHRTIDSESSPMRSYLPTLAWHGRLNQFHHWLVGASGDKGVIHGHFGISLRDGQPVSNKLWPAFATTLQLAFTALLLAFLVGIPLGLQIARLRSQNRASAWVQLLFGIYAMPGFWLGILMVTFLCSPDFLNWFPAAYSLMDIAPDAHWTQRLFTVAYHLVLPIAAWSVGTAAFLAVQTYKESKRIQTENFITTARAKGLSDYEVTKNHVFRNALTPALSLLGSLIPTAFSGAIAIELIFSIPGMGQLIFNPFHTRDYPVVMAILLLVGTAAILSTALSDVALRLIDPRIKSVEQ